FSRAWVAIRNNLRNVFLQQRPVTLFRLNAPAAPEVYATVDDFGTGRLENHPAILSASLMIYPKVTELLRFTLQLQTRHDFVGIWKREARQALKDHTFLFGIMR